MAAINNALGMCTADALAISAGMMAIAFAFGADPSSRPPAGGDCGDWCPVHFDRPEPSGELRALSRSTCSRTIPFVSQCLRGRRGAQIL